jgi:hypothetical protein
LIKESFRAETECTGCAILDSILAPIGFREREGSTVLDAGKFYNFRKSIIPTILREPNDGADAGNFSLENREKDKAIFDYLLRSYALFHLVGRLDIDEEEYGRRGRQLNGYNIDLLDNPEKQEAFLEKIKKGTLTIGDAILGFLTAVELEKLIEDPGNEVGVNALAGFKNYGNGKDTIICYDSNNLSDESVASRFAELKVGEKASFVFNIGQSHFVAARVLHLENNKFIVLHRDALSSNVGLNLKNFIKNNLNFFDRTIEVSLYNIKNKPGFITQNGGMGSVTCGLHAITVLADGGLMDRLEKSIKSTGIAPLEEGEFIEKVDN